MNNMNSIKNRVEKSSQKTHELLLEAVNSIRLYSPPSWIKIIF